MMNTLALDMVLSVSLNCQLIDGPRQSTFMLPLAWLSLPLDKWQRLAGRVVIGLTVAGILGRAIAWGLA